MYVYLYILYICFIILYIYTCVCKYTYKLYNIHLYLVFVYLVTYLFAYLKQLFCKTHAVECFYMSGLLSVNYSLRQKKLKHRLL